MSDPQHDQPRRHARPAPDDERGWLGLVLDLQPFPALVIDLDSGAVVLANQSARGIPLEPPRGAADVDAYHAEVGGARVGPGDLPRALTAPGSPPSGVEIVWHAPDSEPRFFKVDCRALPADGGRSPLALLTFLDITEQRATERELRRALEIRDEFFSIATHELKDPLFALQLSNQLLRRTAERQGEIPAHVLHHLDVGQRQTERLSRLIDNLLDVSRIMNHRLQLDIEALDLGEVVREVAGRFRERAEAAGTPITAESAAEPVIGYFDRLKVEQVLVNLLSNALKYGGGQPVTVRVVADAETVAVEVEDRGPGIAAEDQARIFERFERASGGYRKESLGLGLYIVRSLAEAHGGTVGVRSEPGRGATFAVTLPRKRLPTDAGPPAAGGGPEPTGR